jgi:hypothetical protein
MAIFRRENPEHSNKNLLTAEEQLTMDRGLFRTALRMAKEAEESGDVEQLERADAIRRQIGD